MTPKAESRSNSIPLESDGRGRLSTMAAALLPTSSTDPVESLGICE